MDLIKDTPLLKESRKTYKEGEYSPDPGRIQTYNLLIIRLYRCATTAAPHQVIASGYPPIR